VDLVTNKWYCVTGKQIKKGEEREASGTKIRIFVQSPSKQQVPLKASVAKTLYLMRLGPNPDIEFVFSKPLPIETFDKGWSPHLLGEVPKDEVFLISSFEGHPFSVLGCVRSLDPSYYLLLKTRTGICDWITTDDPGQYGQKGDFIHLKLREYEIIDIIPVVR